MLADLNQLRLCGLNQNPEVPVGDFALLRNAAYEADLSGLMDLAAAKKEK
jgi:hypothetical protein